MLDIGSCAGVIKLRTGLTLQQKGRLVRNHKWRAGTLELRLLASQYDSIQVPTDGQISSQAQH